MQYCYHQHIYYILPISSCVSKDVLKMIIKGKILDSIENMPCKNRKILGIETAITSQPHMIRPKCFTHHVVV